MSNIYTLMGIEKRTNEKLDRDDCLYIGSDGNIRPKSGYGIIKQIREFWYLICRDNDNRVNLINVETGELLDEGWFYYIQGYVEAFCLICKFNPSDVFNGSCKEYGYNFVDLNGNYLSEIWFYYAEAFYDGKAKIRIAPNNKTSYFIDCHGNILCGTVEEMNKQSNKVTDRLFRSIGVDNC